MSAYGSTESLSSQRKEGREKGSEDKGELKAGCRAGVEETDEEGVGEVK